MAVTAAGAGESSCLIVFAAADSDALSAAARVRLVADSFRRDELGCELLGTGSTDASRAFVELLRRSSFLSFHAVRCCTGVREKCGLLRKGRCKGQMMIRACELHDGLACARIDTMRVTCTRTHALECATHLASVMLTASVKCGVAAIAVLKLTGQLAQCLHEHSDKRQTTKQCWWLSEAFELS